MENRDHIDSKHKKVTVPMLISDKVDMKARSVNRDKEQQLKIEEKFSLSENIKSLNGLYLKHSYKILERKKTWKKKIELDKSIIRFRYLVSLLYLTIYKDIEKLSKIVNLWIGIHRTLSPTVKYMLF